MTKDRTIVEELREAGNYLHRRGQFDLAHACRDASEHFDRNPHPVEACMNCGARVSVRCVDDRCCEKDDRDAAFEARV